MNQRNGLVLAVAAACAGAGGWATAAFAEDRGSAERAAAPQVVVQVNAPAADPCWQRGAYRDCGSPYGTSVTVLDAPFQPGAIYFVNPPPAVIRYGNWR